MVVGWQTTDRAPVQISDSVPLRVSGDVQVNGVVETRQTSDSFARVVVAGWERNAAFGPKPILGQPQPLRETAGFGVPVTDSGR
jgi:hypothetical protein